MTLLRGVRAVAIVGLFAVSASPVLADHCGAVGTVTPSTGLAGTTFVFETNLGGPTTVQVFRNDEIYQVTEVDTLGPVSVEVRPPAGREGHWRVHAYLVGAPECTSDVTFEVLAAPDTAIAGGERPSGWPLALTVGVFMLGLAILIAALGLAGRRRVR